MLCKPIRDDGIDQQLRNVIHNDRKNQNPTTEQKGDMQPDR